MITPAYGCMNKPMKSGDKAKLYGAFIKRLTTLGAVQCPRCHDYVYLDTHACGSALTMPDCHALPLAA